MVMSFASKVTGYVTYGLLPDVRRGYAPPTSACLFPGLRLGVGFALHLLGQRPHQGHSPKLKSTRMAGQSHRREANSGGKAELNMPE